MIHAIATLLIFLPSILIAEEDSNVLYPQSEKIDIQHADKGTISFGTKKVVTFPIVNRSAARDFVLMNNDDMAHTMAVVVKQKGVSIAEMVWDSEDVNHSNPHVTIPLPVGLADISVTFESHFAMQANLIILSPSLHASNSKEEAAAGAGIYSAIFCLLLYNLFICLYMRDRPEYRYYLAYNAVTMIVTLSFTGWGRFLLSYMVDAKWFSALAPALSYLSSISLAVLWKFFSSFTRYSSPGITRLEKIYVRSFISIGLISVFITTLDPYLNFTFHKNFHFLEIQRGLFISGAFTLLLTASVLAFKNIYEAKIFLGSFVIIISGSILWLLSLESSQWGVYKYAVGFGQVVQMVFLSSALGKSYQNFMRTINSRIRKEVEEKTSSLEESRIHLEEYSLRLEWLLQVDKETPDLADLKNYLNDLSRSVSRMFESRRFAILVQGYDSSCTYTFASEMLSDTEAEHILSLKDRIVSLTYEEKSLDSKLLVYAKFPFSSWESLYRQVTRVLIISLSPDEPIEADLKYISIVNESITSSIRATYTNNVHKYYDPDTKLANKLFRDRVLVPDVQATLSRNSAGFAIVFADVTGLKGVNDKHGTYLGDRLIRLSAAAIKAAVRPTDLILRLKGDEFIVYMPGASIQEANEVVANIGLNVSQNPLIADNGETVPYDLACGVADSNLSSNFMDVQKRAEEEMNDVKQEYYRRTGRRRGA